MEWNGSRLEWRNEHTHRCTIYPVKFRWFLYVIPPLLLLQIFSQVCFLLFFVFIEKTIFFYFLVRHHLSLPLLLLIQHFLSLSLSMLLLLLLLLFLVREMNTHTRHRWNIIIPFLFLSLVRFSLKGKKN